MMEKTSDCDFPKADFLARMSHEMRTPLSAILGFAQLMASASHSPTAAQKRSLELIVQAGWQLEKLINMTRDLALIESGGLTLSLDRLSVDAILRDCQAMIESQARARDLQLTFPVFETPCYVWADGTRLQQVLDILMSTAIEACAVGGALVVDCAIGSGEWVRIRINRAGPPEAIASESSGISMLLATRLVELMGGELDARSVSRPENVFSLALSRVDVRARASRISTHSRIARAIPADMSASPGGIKGHIL
jgi:signal transduction histidine kinase